MRMLHRKPVLIAFGLVIAIIGVAMLSRPAPTHGEGIGVDFVGYKAATSLPPDYGGPFPTGSRLALYEITNRTDQLLRRIDEAIEIRSHDGWIPHAGQPTLLDLPGSVWFNLSPHCFTYFQVLEPPGVEPWRIRVSFTDVRNVDGTGLRGLLRRVPICRFLPIITGSSSEVAR